MSRARSFGPRLLPPVALLACLFAGLALDFTWPWSLHLDGLALRLGIGLPMFAASLVLGASALLALRQNKTSPEPGHIPTALVTSGPYRWSRNPLYIALLLTHGGFSAVLNSGWLLATIPILFGWLDRRVIAAEEQAIASHFWEPYQDYCRAVRRWL